MIMQEVLYLTYTGVRKFLFLDCHIFSRSGNLTPGRFIAWLRVNKVLQPRLTYLFVRPTVKLALGFSMDSFPRVSR
jgi:hypothetical protein